MNSRRQLAAIVFADIAGYTAMMQENENVALQKLNHFRDDIDRIVPDFNGTIIQYYGDGCLLIFNSALEAISCSVQLQQSLQEDPLVPVRIGIHQGDIVMENGLIFGNNVNIAARIESMSIPGAILLSAKVQSELVNQHDIELQSLGSYEFKNVKLPIEVFAYTNNGFPIPRRHEITGKFKVQNEEKSIAVLAFKNQSSDTEQEYFSEGIAEEIIYGLSQLDNLKVAGRRSSFSFKNSLEPLGEIASQLKVAHVLEGSVRKAGNRIRVNVQLVDAKDGFQIWTERFDRELEDIFSIQDEIAEKVTQKLKLTLLGQEKGPGFINRKTKDVKAFELYLQGRKYLDNRTEIEKALNCFNEAIGIDPEFAAAYTSLAYAYFYKIVFENYPPTEGFPKAEVAVKRALSLDSTIAEAHSLQGLVDFYFHHQLEKARMGYEKALILQPKLADTYRVKAYFHTMLLEPEFAISCAEKSYELDPLSFNNGFSLGDVYYRTGRYQAAIDTFSNLIEKFPKSAIAQDMLGVSYYLSGDSQKAKSILQVNRPIPEHLDIYHTHRIILQVMWGDTDSTRSYLTLLLRKQKSEWISPTLLAVLFFSLGEEEQGLKQLEKAQKGKDPALFMIDCLPLWKPYKELPQVQVFMNSWKQF